MNKEECKIVEAKTSLDYQSEYFRLQESYKRILDENEQLKKALLKIALKL